MVYTCASKLYTAPLVQILNQCWVVINWTIENRFQWELIKMKWFSYKKINRISRLQHGVHFVSASMYLYLPLAGDWAYKTTTWQGKECFSTSTSSTNTGLVVGVILGLAAFFILAIGFAVCMRYRAMRGRASAQGGHVVVASSCGNPVPPIASTPVPANQGYTQPYTINTAPANPCYTQPYAINTAPAEQGYTQPYTTEPQYTTPMWSTAPGNGDQPPSYEQAAMDKVW